MNKYDSVTQPVAQPLRWFMTLLLAAFVAGCGGGGGQDPILGGSGAGVGASVGPLTVAPGALTCVAANANPLIPRVISSDPSNGNLNATTSTTDPATGLPGPNKLITATFSLAMNPATITPVGIFTLRNNTTNSPVAGIVTMSGTSIANTIATFTTPTLPAGNSFTATITQTAATPGGITLACIYAWTFTTVAAPPSGLSQVNLGRASTFGIAATAGVTNTGTLPNTNINGDVVLDPTATCNAVAVPGGAGTAGFGLCGGFAPTLNGTVVTPASLPAGTSTGVRDDLLAAFLSITPPAGPPAAGSLGGATPIAAGTTLGAPTGNALVQGDNLFTPGVYQSITSILITDDLTLDALGNPDAVFVFQSSSTVGTAAGAAPPGVRTRILLVNGAKASNVWWQAGTSATLGAFSEFQGNILASESITMITGATSCGRLLAGAFAAGAFVFDSNVVSVPGQPFAPPAGYSAICE